jgi:hypothetical protein
MTGLERRYRRLLWAYPAPYRRRHGAEIVTTLLEMAESGHGRPTTAHMVHLVACGLRQRFRLPVGRPLAPVAAVLAAIVFGALGAAGGTWLSWQLASAVPSNDAMRTMTADLVGGGRTAVAVDRWETAMQGPAVDTRVTVHSAYSADRVRSALTAAGWRITTFTEVQESVVADFGKDSIPARTVRFNATKDGLSLSGDSMSVAEDARYEIGGQTLERLDVWANDTAAVRPVTVIGLLFGAVAGWLIAAALADRVRRGGPARRDVVVLLVVTAFVAAVAPIVDRYRDLYQVLIYDSGAPNPYIVYGPGDHFPADLVRVCAVVGLLALAAAFFVARRGDRADSEPTGQAPLASG